MLSGFSTKMVDKIQTVGDEKKIICPSGKVIRKSIMGPKGFDSRLLSEFCEVRILGRGGFGVVVESVNELDRQHYAIKKIMLDADEDSFYDSVISEVLCLAQIANHNVVRYFSAWFEPSVVGVYEEDESDGSMEGVGSAADAPCLFIQMELCSTSLDKLLEKNKLKVEEVWSIFRQILNGLHHVHSKKIRHGDLKPSNVFLRGEVVKLGDFGLACSSKEAAILPIARGIYTAPELKTVEKPFTMLSDVFSLGMILFEMLDGFNFGTKQEK